MDEEVLQRLESSFVALKDQGDVLTETFYGRLFTNHPEVRSMFPDDMQHQRKKLFQSVAFVVANLRKSDALREKLLQMGAEHVSYGTKAEHYPVVRDNLVAAMGEVAGDLWSEQLEADWKAALDAVSAIMIEGAAQANAEV